MQPMSNEQARWVVVIGIVLAVALLAATADAGEAVGGSRVLVIGDSIVNLSASDVRQDLAVDGWQPVVVGRPGLSTEAWEPLVGADAALARPSVAVVELGTNDCDTSCNDLGPAIDSIVGTLVQHGARAVLWLNVQTGLTNIPPGAPRVYPAHADYVNYALEQAAVRWPQLQIVDFRDFFQNHPQWHLADGLHPNATGQEELASLIGLALHRWAPSRSASATEDWRRPTATRPAVG